mmetsp:Transcript_33176/g.50057  ORF Transcript_33176/g.50057 Transcript_33176/m.50057 type:complete len:86 (+) Transcript_33176:485-742(+)
MGTRFEFGKRAELWADICKSRFKEPPNFGAKTGMSRNRFDNMWSAIRWSDQPVDRPDGMSPGRYRWRLIDDFVTAFNDYRDALMY